jgi:hypothetical protein
MWAWILLVNNFTQAMFYKHLMLLGSNFSNCLGAYKDVWTLANKSRKVGKKNLAQWMFLILKKVWTRLNICKGFKIIGI